MATMGASHQAQHVLQATRPGSRTAVSMAPVWPRRLAAIDIGSNSIHMIVVEATDRRTFHTIDREREMVKLGAGTFGTGRLSPQAIDGGVSFISHCVDLARRRGSEEIIAVATSAV